MNIAHEATPITARDQQIPALIHTLLPQFGLIRCEGEEAAQFLNGQLSCDVLSLAIGQARYGSYNTPKGRMLASFLLWRDHRGYLLQMRRDIVETTRKRLAIFVLRAKVKLSDVSEQCALLGLAGSEAHGRAVAAFPAVPEEALTTALSDEAAVLRLDASRFIVVATPERNAALAASLPVTAETPSLWDWLDVRSGIPYISAATQDQFVPQMANLDLIGGVSFNKGCYPGQEIVARMHYLGRLKQRMYLAHLDDPAIPASGDKLYSARFGEQACGSVLSAAAAPGGGYDVLAVLQIESASHDDVRWKSPEGAQLQLLELPYAF